jgi:GNAT superfamily N-acetyltransferase
MTTTLKSIPNYNMTLIVREGEKHLWKKFHPYHYMTANKDPKTSLPNGAKFFTFYWVKDDMEILVGCLGVMFQIASYPAKRLTRTIVLPEFQGLGISTKMINSISDFYTKQGFKVYGATYHPRLGEYRENSKNWSAGHYNQREFKLSKDHNEKSMSGLRDGEKMYRHYFTQTTDYDLLYNPLELAELEKQILVLEKEINDDNIKEYKALRKKLNKIYGIINKVLPKQKEPEIGSLTDEDNEKYKQSVKRNKRKVLTRDERIELKKLKKLKKESK